jgi:hypothetical protein
MIEAAAEEMADVVSMYPLQVTLAASIFCRFPTRLTQRVMHKKAGAIPDLDLSN